MTLSSFQANPRQGHLDRLANLWVPLQNVQRYNTSPH
jgi:hypothetical protein